MNIWWHIQMAKYLARTPVHEILGIDMSQLVSHRLSAIFNIGNKTYIRGYVNATFSHVCPGFKFSFYIRDSKALLPCNNEYFQLAPRTTYSLIQVNADCSLHDESLDHSYWKYQSNTPGVTFTLTMHDIIACIGLVIQTPKARA